MYKNIDQDLAKLTLSCQLKIEEQNHLKEILDEIDKTNRDGHLIFIQIGEKLGFKPENIIKGAFFEYWIQYNLPFCTTLSEKVKELLEQT